MAADSAVRGADLYSACAAGRARDSHCDSDSAADSDVADGSRWDSGRADDFRRRSILAAEIADVAVATVDAAADPGFAQAQLQPTVRNRAL